MTKIVGIRFRTAGKIYYFDPADFDLDMAMHCYRGDSKRHRDGNCPHSAEGGG